MAWDVAAGAGGYGGFAALLTGFAISALVWIGATDRAKDHPRSIGLLFASVVPLACATLLYAEVGAELICARRSAAIPFPSFLLAIGAGGIFLAMYDLLSDDLTENHDRRVTAAGLWTVILLASMSVITGSASLTATFSATGEVSAAVAGQGALLAVALLVFWWLPARNVEGVSRPTYAHRLAFTTLLITIGAYAWFFLLAFNGEPESSYHPLAVSWARTVVWIVFLAAARLPRRPLKLP